MSLNGIDYGYMENTNLSNDNEIIKNKNKNNENISSYYLHPLWNPEKKSEVSPIQQQYLNTMSQSRGRFQNKVIDPLQQTIDIESNLLLGKDGNLQTSYPQKRTKQLASPLFAVTPDLSQGQIVFANPDLMSNLWNGYETRVKKSVGPTAGVNINRFTPMVDCLEQNIQNTKHIIPEYWVRGGMDTRSIIRNIDYLSACGLKNIREVKKDISAFNA